MWSIWLPALVAACAVLATAPIVIKVLRRLKVLDVASERSSHTGVAIRGMGISVLIGIISGLLVDLFGASNADRDTMLVIGVTTLLAALLGAVEDFKGLSIGIRAGLQVVIAALASVSLLYLTSSPWLWGIPALLFIAGYINVTNFMDGVDGISGVHGALAGVFYLCLGYILDTSWLAVVGGVVAGSFLAFLPWNLRRRGTFLGDTGSYLLGAAVATTAIATWFAGINPIAALGPTIIYCTDAGGTLLRRIIEGEQWYRPHRNHIYQQLTGIGFTHLAASTVVGIFTVIVAGLTLLLAPQSGWNDGVVYILIIGVCATYWYIPIICRKISEDIHTLDVRRNDISHD